jgi:hypothetical protein
LGCALQQNSGGKTPVDFRRLVMQGGVDSVIFLKADGSVSYPTPTPPFAPNSLATPEQKAQEQIRSLVQSGKKDAAIEAIEKNFRGNSLVAADERLLLLRLTKSREVMRRLIAQIDDYSAPMPSPHRLFLMDAVKELALDTAFPTLAAERLAAQFVEAGGAYSLDPALQRTRLPDIWQLVPPNHRTIALFRTDTVVGAMRSLIEPSSVRHG